MVFRKYPDAGFYRFRRISVENALPSTGDLAGDTHNASCVHTIVYVLVTNQYATYYDIIHKYNIWEVLDLYEMAMVHLYNKALALESIKNKK